MKNKKFYNFWSLSIVLSVILVVFSLILVSCAGNKNKPPASTNAPGSAPPAGSTAPPESASPTVLAETSDMGQAYIDSFIFLGDSTTYGLRFYGVLSGGENTTQVWTPENGTFALFNQSTVQIKYPDTGENISIEQALTNTKPQYLVSTLGVNGVSLMEEDSFKREYKALIERIQLTSPDTKIILNSIYPVTSSYDGSAGITNAKIDTANGWVLSVAEEMGLRYLDTASILKGSDGALPADYSNDGEMHLTKEALQLVVNYVRTHGYV